MLLSTFRPLLTSYLVFAASAQRLKDAPCQSIGLDYSDGGSYLIDGTVDGKFSFASEFLGSCDASTASTSLRDESGNTYACSPISVFPLGEIQISTCDIPYSSLTTGDWQINIVLSPTNSITRTFRLTIAVQPTIITPTVVVGTTVTPPPTTTIATAEETRIITLQPATLTSACRATTTLTTTSKGPLVVVTETSTVLKPTTDRKVTSLVTVLSTRTPACKPPTTLRTTTPATKAASTTSAGNSACAGANPGWGGPFRPPGWGPFRPPARPTGLPWPWNGGLPPNPWAPLPPCPPQLAKVKRATAAIAAVTSTYIQTTYTVTRTTTVYLAPATVTRYAIGTVVQTITPAPSTVCAAAGTITKVATSTIDGQTLTIVTVVTAVTHVTETVFIR
ncbi:hypothetical protein QBC37DRAFT_375858 [Rhypophila decipiens]|uniref:Uncharacterized protein n=1 Tax=Rhypophila decipiens TaxID=261697 RepID=A0AAN6Y7P1_9PEZI|nr:hypothetical protein QBC37DRAFT_375858 [Rhypophila decipiens]